MTVHINAQKDDIADKVLLPGDPLRAKYIAETFLDDAVCYNDVRGMLGFTGTFRGQRVSVQGTGMGMPSASIYIHELINGFGAKKLIRTGTCGAIRTDVNVRDVIIAQAACTDSGIIRNTFAGLDYAPIGSFDMIHRAYLLAEKTGLDIKVGSVFSADQFYSDNDTVLPKLAQYGVLAVEMETAALYTLAAKFGVESLSVLTVSDHVLTGEQTTAEERQNTFNEMIVLALETMVSN